MGGNTSQRLITPVANNLEKYYTYREYISRYNRAMKEAFYFEALLIDYAILEDRLRSFLYHMGALKNRKSTSIDCQKTRGLLKQIVNDYSEKNESKNLGISSITGKMRVVRCVAMWASTVSQISLDNKYGIVLKCRMEDIDIDRLLGTLTEIHEWCQYRNEIIHCLLNKNTDSVSSNIVEQAAKGFFLARELDVQIREFKRGNIIRKKLNLPTERAAKIPAGNLKELS